MPISLDTLELKRALSSCEIPERMHGGFIRYFQHGILPGSFTQAILRGDLFDAAARADHENQHLLWNYCNFLYNYAPTWSYGSETALKQYSQERREATKKEGNLADVYRD